MRPGLPLLAFAALAACGENGGGGQAPPPPPPAAPAALTVDPCLTQMVLPGRSVAIEVVPDTLTLDLARPPVFPNGRSLTDPVIDYTLAFLFLDLNRHPIDTLFKLPLNPPANDLAFPGQFPWLAPAQGNPPLASGNGQGFVFRSDSPSAYVRVDRMGMPAVATALIRSSSKSPYNDDSIAEDLTSSAGGEFKWVPELRASLLALTRALEDDLEDAGLTGCARRE